MTKSQQDKHLIQSYVESRSFRELRNLNGKIGEPDRRAGTGTVYITYTAGATEPDEELVLSLENAP